MLRKVTEIVKRNILIEKVLVKNQMADGIIYSKWKDENNLMVVLRKIYKTSEKKGKK